MINIYGHLFQEDQVIGIGPLMVKPSSSEVERMLYRSASYWFDVYLSHYKVEISTNSLRFENDNQTLGKVEFERFKEVYLTLSSDLKSGNPLINNFGI